MKRRETPFRGTCHISSNEIEMAVMCLESEQWSSFKGGLGGWDYRECCEMPSSEAAEYGPTDIPFLGGKFVRRFERDVAAATNVGFAISANSATSALVMALAAMNVGPGDEVLVPCLSFNASATAVLFTNAIPVFCEVKPETLCIDPDDLESKITERTKAILVVHFAGGSADMDRIMRIAARHNLKVLEDCAQAPGVSYKGAPLGSIGDAGVFSYTETKNITCGEGGMVTTNDPAIARKARLVRNHGEGVAEYDWPAEELANLVGMNFRLTELQAAVAIPQFENLGERNRQRNENWAVLCKGLREFSDELIPLAVEPGCEAACHNAYWRWSPKNSLLSRSDILEQANRRGLPLGVAYGRLMHENPIYTRRIGFGVRGSPWSENPRSEVAEASYGKGGCPRTEVVNESLISFKFINPPNTRGDMDDAAAILSEILSGH